MNRSEALTMWRDPEDIVLSERESDTKSPIVCDSTDRKCPEQMNPETGNRLMGAGWNEV
jgi:hypothetical protein